MSSKLKNYFPMIWERKELIAAIQEDANLSSTFYGWEDEIREEFLDFCTGMRGLKILYDPFFKEIMNPEYASERLDDFLSVLLQKKVKIKAILPNDSTRISDENTLLITDIVVELADGSLANVEVQKLGYMFPGERSACYSSDLLLRQYKRVRSLKKKKFSYQDIKEVYVIVLFEESTKEFHKFPEHYIHNSEQITDTGLKLNLLQKFVFIPLDIFKKRPHNKVIKNELEAWLTFLSADRPEEILRLIESYPKFRQMYQQVYDMCRNLEAIMGLFSEELKILDRNTVQLMIDQMQDTINQQSEALAEKDEALAEKDEALAKKDEALAKKDEALAKKDEALQKVLEKIKELEALQKHRRT